VPAEVSLRYVDLTVELQILSFFRSRKLAMLEEGKEGPF
jgi:hypothetical protein